MKMAAISVPGVESLRISKNGDRLERLCVTGDIDPVILINRVRKIEMADNR